MSAAVLQKKKKDLLVANKHTDNEHFKRDICVVQ